MPNIARAARSLSTAPPTLHHRIRLFRVSEGMMTSSVGLFAEVRDTLERPRTRGLPPGSLVATKVHTTKASVRAAMDRFQQEKGILILDR